MNPQEAATLLAMLSSIDNREVDAVRAQGWAFALDDIPFDVAKLALHDALHADDIGYIDHKAIRRFAAPHIRRIARDVKSAKIRGFIPDEWPDTRPLPAPITARLVAEWETNNNPISEIAAPNPGGTDLGEIGRRIPDEESA
jgi:hypothetical protein